MDDWNYDLENIPRGCPIMVRTRLGTGRIAIVVTEKWERGRSRIRCRVFDTERWIYATAWRHLTDEEAEGLGGPWLGMVRARRRLAVRARQRRFFR